MLWMAVMLAAGVLAMGPWLLASYLGRLPYAPECPQCRAVTGQYPGRSVLDRAGALLSATPVRHCARCGWAGRMRWRAAPEPARGPHRHPG